MSRKLSMLITAGPTQESFDPVRYISNHSSGKMGYALARACLEKKLKVILISGPTHLTPPAVDQFISVTTAREMLSAVLKKIKNIDIFIACAAVADYQPKTFSKQKIKKKNDAFILELIKTPDILKTVSQLHKKPVLVGFCAETDHLIENAKKKLIEKKLDFILANRIHVTGEPLYSDENELMLIDKGFKESFFPKNTKSNLAKEIIKKILQFKSKID